MQVAINDTEVSEKPSQLILSLEKDVQECVIEANAADPDKLPRILEKNYKTYLTEKVNGLL